VARVLCFSRFVLAFVCVLGCIPLESKVLSRGFVSVLLGIFDLLIAKSQAELLVIIVKWVRVHNV
jgi:hypothetical protein